MDRMYRFFSKYIMREKEENVELKEMPSNDVMLFIPDVKLEGMYCCAPLWCTCT